MKLLIDECLPAALRATFTAMGHECLLSLALPMPPGCATTPNAHFLSLPSVVIPAIRCYQPLAPAIPSSTSSTNRADAIPFTFAHYTAKPETKTRLDSLPSSNENEAPPEKSQNPHR
jgi:hypothetical protein